MIVEDKEKLTYKNSFVFYQTLYKRLFTLVNDIVDESNRHENVETGGLLFGKFIEEYIIILKLIHFSTNAKRTQVYFEMDEDFAINITKQMEKNNLAYLGNWHKHLGYGGPSNGDDKQAELFLLQNSHKRNYLSLIIDFYNNDYYLAFNILLY